MATLSLLQIIIIFSIVFVLVGFQTITGLWILTKLGLCPLYIWPKWVPFGKIIPTTITELLVSVSLVFLVHCIIFRLS